LERVKTKEQAEHNAEYFKLEEEMLRARERFLRFSGESPRPWKPGDGGRYNSKRDKHRLALDQLDANQCAGAARKARCHQLVCLARADQLP
jgi:hypothetical protein